MAKHNPTIQTTYLPAVVSLMVKINMYLVRRHLCPTYQMKHVRKKKTRILPFQMTSLENSKLSKKQQISILPP